MADRDDLDIPPASDDEAVQNYLETNWREAVRASRDGREAIRRIFPELVEHLPETAANHLRTALGELEGATRALHKAGRHVLGQTGYDEFLSAQTRRQIET